MVFTRQKNTLLTVKHNRNVMLWGGFAVSGPEIIREQVFIKKEQYLSIYKNYITQSTQKL